MIFLEPATCVCIIEPMIMTELLDFRDRRVLALVGVSNRFSCDLLIVPAEGRLSECSTACGFSHDIVRQ